MYAFYRIKKPGLFLPGTVNGNTKRLVLPAIHNGKEQTKKDL